MAPTPPDEYFFEQVTKHKKDISLLQSRVHALEQAGKITPKQPEYVTTLGARVHNLEVINKQLRQDIIRQQEELQAFRNRSLWERIFG